MFSLVGISFFQSFFDKGEDLVVAEVEPGFGDQIAGWHFAGKAFDDDVGVEALDEVDDEFDVIVEGEKMKISGVGEVFVSHFCIFEYLELVELHRGEWQLRDDVGGVKHHVAGFAWQSEDEMSAAGETVGVYKPDGVFGGGEGVAAVDARQCLVVNGLHSKFD